MLQRLHEVGLQRILQQGRHGTGGVDVLGGERPAVLAVGEGDAAEPLTQVFERSGEAEYGHHLAGNSDVVAALPRHAVERPAEAEHDLAQYAVVEVDNAAPGDRERIDIEFVAMHDVRIDHGCEQVVGHAHGVDVAGEVKVEVLHGHQLRVTAAGGSPLDAEDRPQRRLAQCQHRPPAELAHRFEHADGGDGLALA